MWPFTSKKSRKSLVESVFKTASTTPGISGHSVPFDVDLLQECDVSGLFAYGIFNPMGPTLNVISLLSHSTAEQSLLHYRMLNPFAQESAVIGVLPKHPTQDELIDIIPDAFVINQISETVLIGGLPSFLLHGGSQELLVLAMTSFCQHVVENKRTSEMQDNLCVLKQYEGRPWDRATHELKNAFQSIVAERKGTMPAQTQSQSAGEDNLAAVTEWIEYMMSPHHSKPELQGFLQSWEGSIEAQKGNYLAKAAMPLPQMLSFVFKSNIAFMQQVQAASR